MLATLDLLDLLALNQNFWWIDWFSLLKLHYLTNIPQIQLLL